MQQEMTTMRNADNGAVPCLMGTGMRSPADYRYPPCPTISDKPIDTRIPNQPDPDGKYSCANCTTRLSSRGHLQRHIKRVHLCQRDHHCPIDGCAFRCFDNDTLQTHILFHNNDRPIACPQCPRRFFTKSLQRTHWKSKHEEKAIECDVCGKMFSHKPDMRRHKLRYHLRPPLICHFCSRIFRRFCAYKRHLEKAHRAESATDWRHICSKCRRPVGVGVRSSSSRYRCERCNGCFSRFSLPFSVCECENEGEEICRCDVPLGARPLDGGGKSMMEERWTDDNWRSDGGGAFSEWWRGEEERRVTRMLALRPPGRKLPRRKAPETDRSLSGPIKMTKLITVDPNCAIQ